MANRHQHHYYGGGVGGPGENIIGSGRQGSNATSNSIAASFQLKCTDLPQFDALLSAADQFRHDDKLSLRNLCNDTARCAGLTAVHAATAAAAGSGDRQQNDATAAATGGGGGGSPVNSVAILGGGGAAQQPQLVPPPVVVPAFRKMILDYSRQRVTGETMELLYDLADAVGLMDRIKMMRTGQRINATDDLPVLHHILRIPGKYNNVSFSSELAANVQQNSQQQSSSGALQRPRSISQRGRSAPAAILSSFIPDGPGPSFPPSSEGRSNTGGTTGSGGSGGGGDSTVAALVRETHKLREAIRMFTEQVRSGSYLSITGKPFVDFLVVSSTFGGIDAVATALETGDADAASASRGYRLRFLSNVDPVEFYAATADLDPTRTLVVVISKTFTDPECVLNTRTTKSWLVKGVLASLPSQENRNDEQQQQPPVPSESEITQRHFVAVTCNPTRCAHFGIAKDKVFRIWDWVIPRFAVCSAAGLLPLSLRFSYAVLSQLLAGAHNIDEHFFHAPPRDNIPTILGLLGVWNSTFLGYSCRAVLPYSHSLRQFPEYVQYVDMVSNGKRVALDGTPLLHQSAEISFGQAGTTCQTQFFQLLHQGRVVPVDFIGFIEAQNDLEVPGEAVSNHDELMSNFFAQPDALAYGKTLIDLVQEGTPERLREHMVFTGNRPSSSILMTKLDAFAIGQLMALYEHRTAVQGFIWGINSFDAFGLDLGRALVKTARAQLSASRKTGASVQGFNFSTSTLLDHYLAHGRVTGGEQ